jgi:DNA-binding NtrC family response regulator
MGVGRGGIVRYHARVPEDAESTVTKPSERDDAGTSPRRLQLRVVFPFELAGAIPVGASRSLGRKDAPCLHHASVSREHATVRSKGLGVEIADSGSRNGTFVHGVRVAAPVFVPPDTVVRLGDVIAVLEAIERDDERVERAAIPGDASSTRALRRLVGRVAPGIAPVLLLGETGTGKERVAREIHRVSGRGAFVAFNAAGLTRDLADSQLFGHRRGAFTGATESREGLFRRADGGTLFLDEVAELAPEVQAKLLRSLETGAVHPIGHDEPMSVNVRIVAATQPDLDVRVADGRFRRDLYARLALAEISVPPLRARIADVPSWAALFDERWSETESGPSLSWTSEAMERLMLASWPENLRGLERTVYRLRCTREDSDWSVGARDLEPMALDDDSSEKAIALPPKPSKAELERVLAENDGSVRRTAKHFNRDRRQIYRWIEAYDLPRGAP